jgi:hypothetical protein
LQAEIRSANTAYLESHPEVRATLSDFMSAVLVAKPEVSVGGMREGVADARQRRNHSG